MMKQRNLFVEELDDMVTPGYNINEGDQGVKCSVVDLVHRALAIKKISDDLNKTVEKKIKKARNLSTPKNHEEILQTPIFL